MGCKNILHLVWWTMTYGRHRNGGIPWSIIGINTVGVIRPAFPKHENSFGQTIPSKRHTDAWCSRKKSRWPQNRVCPPSHWRRNLHPPPREFAWPLIFWNEYLGWGDGNILPLFTVIAESSCPLVIRIIPFIRFPYWHDQHMRGLIPYGGE